MTEITISDHEKECLRFLAQRYDGGGNRVGVQEFPRHDELGQQEIFHVIARFENFGWLEWETNASLTIDSSVLDVVDQIDNPRPKDYWKGLATWFRSRPWSIPVLLLLIGLPLIIQWIDMIKTVLRWMLVLE